MTENSAPKKGLTNAQASALQPRDIIIQEVTDNFIKTSLPTMRAKNIPKADISAKLYTATVVAIDTANLIRNKGSQLRIPQTLTPQQIADLMLQYHTIRLIDFIGDATDRDQLKLATYQDSGSEEGLYTISEEALRSIARQFNYELSSNSFAEVKMYLTEKAPLVTPTQDKHIVPVNNGLFNYNTKQLVPFSPEHVILTKARTDYNPNARNINIYNPEDGTNWDVESWMAGLSDDPEVVHALWATVAAAVRPFHNWDKMVLLYSEQGANGKGTFCSMIRNVLGSKATASISLLQFSQRFGLAPLIGINAVITDENPVGSYVEQSDALKSAITGDSLTIEAKHKNPIAYKFNGFILQCVNELPKTQDRSDSFYRRQLFLPMLKLFTGRERKYIKHDYLKRKEVLEYVLYRVLHMDLNELPIPEVSRTFLDEYKSYNDPVRDFFNTIEGELVWQKIPNQFLYDLYKAWFSRNHASGKVKSSSTFNNEIKQLLVGNNKWEVVNGVFKPTLAMKQTPEPLILQYKLEDWANPTYRGDKPEIKALANFQSATYRGIQRLQ